MAVRSRRCETIKDSAARTCRWRWSRALCLNAILVELPRILIGYGSRPAVISQSGQTVLSDRPCSSARSDRLTKLFRGRKSQLLISDNRSHLLFVAYVSIGLLRFGTLSFRTQTNHVEQKYLRRRLFEVTLTARVSRAILGSLSATYADFTHQLFPSASQVRLQVL